MHKEGPTTENLDLKNNPESTSEEKPKQILDAAFTAVENKNDPEPTGWKDKAKNFFQKESVRDFVDIGILGAAVYVKATKFGILKFLWQALKKEGKITFSEGYNIGNDMFSFDGKEKK
ncbi:MAG: hypothetical protein NTW11_03605 [Candidatus Staskawiczbacteria bacterium]|nr:hypothetical protein [Candidatus Staskawiczbacteria bacterium]